MTRGALRRVAVVAWNETRRSGGAFDGRTRLVLVALGVALAVVMPHVSEHGLDFERGIYRAAVEPGSPLEPAILGSSVFTVVRSPDARAAVDAGAADVAVGASWAYARDTDKGNAALAAVEDASKAFAIQVYLAEPDSDAAFPVRVLVAYEEQPRPIARAAGFPESPRDRPRSGSTGGAIPEAPTSGPVVVEAPEGGFRLLPAEETLSTPGTMAPPFPFRSLILAYVFLIPMNFVVQVYAGSVIAERIGRQGEPLLSSPARPWEIVAGKTAPYFAAMALVSVAVCLWIGAGWLSFVAVLPLTLAFLALEFVAALFARSFRELTFLTVFSSVLLTIYAFLPAVFTDVHPVSLVSPISLVVLDLKGEVPTLGEALYATLPLTLLSAALFVLGMALFREEDLFHQKPVHAKALDALARHVRGIPSAFKLSFVLIPAVFVLELLLVTFLFAWPFPVGILGVLLVVALVEEAFKAAPAFAAFRGGGVPWRRAVAFGAVAGFGFFVAEKAFLLASLVGLFEVPAGAAVFGVGGGSTALPLVLLAPLALHVATASLTAWGASRSRSRFAASFAAAVALHAGYNLVVVEVVGGGIP